MKSKKKKEIHRLTMYNTFKLTLLMLYSIICISINGQVNFPYNLLIVKEHPINVHLNYLEVKDSIVLINISANNKFNDSISAEWINIDPQTRIHSGQSDYWLMQADGIAISPQITRYTSRDQTITFNLQFPKFNLLESFDLIETDDSNWKFKRCHLYKPFASNETSVYYAPDRFGSLLYKHTMSLMQEGNFEGAAQINQYMFEFLKKHFITSYQLEATISYNLAGCYNQLHEDTLALEYGYNVIKHYKNHHWAEDLALARVYGILFDVYSRNNNYPMAIQMGEESLRIKQLLYPNGNTDVAMTLGKLSTLYADVENYDSAIIRGQQAIIMRERLNGIDYKNNLPIVLNLCLYYYIQQRYADALELALSYYNNDSVDIDLSANIKFCGLISHSYQNLGNIVQAHKYALRGYELLRTLSSHDDGECLSSPKFDSQKVRNELLNFQDFFPIKEKIFTEEEFLKSEKYDEFYFGIMQNLSLDYYEIGDLVNAIKVQKQCLTLREETQIHNDVKECESWNHLLYYYFLVEDSINFNNIKDTCFHQTEKVYGIYSYEYADLLNISYGFNYSKERFIEAFQDLSLSIEVYKYLILRDFPILSYDDRECLWREFEEWFDQIYLDCYLMAIHSNPKLANSLNELLYNTILFSKGLLLNSQVANKACEKMENYHIDRLNKREIISSVLLNELYGTWKDVLASLDSSSVAIEFIHDENTDEIISLTINHNSQAPILDYVCSAKDLNKLIRNNATPSEYNRLLWTNIAKHIFNKEYIYISLDGFLNAIPIENYLIDSRFVLQTTNIFRVSSTRNICKLNDVSLDNCLLLGGLIYGDLNNRFVDLPESEEEVREISALLKQTGKNATQLSGKDGTKESLIQHLNSPFSTIHLATHAFYWKESSSSESKYSRVLAGGDSIGYKTDKRLYRSGVVLSATDTNDQILTSYDVASLNLSQVSFVVLPNCKSGIGVISNDGIIGLQRAFKEAQAGTILMSLWDVNDLATRLFMVEFYRLCLSGEGVHNALKQSQRYLRNYTDDSGIKLFDSPCYWAGFVILD